MQRVSNFAATRDFESGARPGGLSEVVRLRPDEREKPGRTPLADIKPTKRKELTREKEGASPKVTSLAEL